MHCPKGKVAEAYKNLTQEVLKNENRSGEKIKLASIDELLGVVNEESAMEIESVRSIRLRIIRSRCWMMKRCRTWLKA